MGRLDGKRALISGTGGGIGRATALLCALEGAHVVGCDLHLQRPPMRRSGRSGPAAGGWTRSPRSTWPPRRAPGSGSMPRRTLPGGSTCWSTTRRRSGSARSGELSFADWSFTIRNELEHRLPRHARGLAAPGRRRGRVDRQRRVHHRIARGVLHAAERARRANGGVLALTYQLVVEGGPHGIRVNAVSPAMTETPQTAPLLRDPGGPAASIAARVPLGRWGQPEDVARAILFLCSDKAPT